MTPSPIAIPPAQLLRTRAGIFELIDEGAGPALLALHGGMGGYDQSWLLAKTLLSDEERFRILALSRPGYLGTAQKIGTTPQAQADSFVALLDELKIGKALVAAVSAGGPSALYFAQRHPERCAGLVMVSTATGKLDMAAEILSRTRSMQLFAHVPGLPWLFRQGVLHQAEEAARRGIKDAELARRTLNDPEAGPMMIALQAGIFSRMSERLAGTVNDTELFQAMTAIPFADVRVPTLVLHGTDDDVVPLSHARAVAKGVPGAKLVTLSGGGHMALFSHLDEVRSATKDFLSGLRLKA